MAKSKGPGRPRGSGDRVGRGKPRKPAQFKESQSGKGRRRPNRNKKLRALIAKLTASQVTATIDGKQGEISRVQAAIMQLAGKAASGDPKAIIRFLNWIDAIEARARRRKSRRN
jgi:hypothetical protein